MRFVAFDTETYGLEITDKMFGFSLAQFNTSGDIASSYCDIRENPEHLGLIRRLDQQDVIWCMHNAKFDLWRLALEGIYLKNPVLCTKTLVKLADNSRESYSLDACAPLVGHKKDDTVEKWITENKAYEMVSVPGKKATFKRKFFDKVPLDIISHYAKVDAEVCLKLAVEYYDKIPKDVLESEMALTKTLFEMEFKGIKIDPVYTEIASRETEDRVGRLHTEFAMKTGKKFVSSAKVLKPIFDEAGLSYKLTDKGNPSFDKESLELMDHPIPKLIQEIRNSEKYVQTYYSSFLHHARHDGRVHANFEQGGPRTFRLSCNSPNMQNVPKEEDEREVYVRKCFVPGEGRRFVFIDYKQMEFRVLMDYAEEFDVIERINAGEDAHQIVADEINVSRKEAKTIQFGLLYGMGEDSLALALGCSKAEASRLKKRYFSRYRKVEKFMRSLITEARKRGYVETWDGVKLHLPALRQYSILNHLIQGGCARVIRRAMPLAARVIPDSLVLQVHDELIFEISPKDTSELVEGAKSILENTYVPRAGVRLECDVEYSDLSWGHKDRKKYDGS